ncbi:MAG: AI-2E family transporter [Qingshengfaniella sp.]
MPEDPVRPIPDMPAGSSPDPVGKDRPHLRDLAFADLFMFVALAVLIGWVLYIGQQVILPIVVALMLTYVLTGAVQALRRPRLFHKMPVWLAYLVVLVLTSLSLGVIALVAVVNLRSIALSLSVPTSEEQVMVLIGRISDIFGLADTPTWETVRAMTLDRLDLAGFSLGLLSGVAAMGSYTALILTYVAFMLAERTMFQRRLDKILLGSSERGTARLMIERVNSQIVTYLSTKTLINIALGLLSYLIMLLLGVKNAVFWAFLIALFNYIPYVGSLIGVATVTIYVLAFRADLAFAALTCLLLTAAQIYVGNVLEPRIMGRTLNLSPVVVLISLVVWSSLWGLPGAIIAVPMTSVIMIILAEFRRTRMLAVLASANGEV